MFEWKGIKKETNERIIYRNRIKILMKNEKGERKKKPGKIDSPQCWIKSIINK